MSLDELQNLQESAGSSLSPLHICDGHLCLSMGDIVCAGFGWARGGFLPSDVFGV